MSAPPTIGLVISTLGRSDALRTMFDSIAKQTTKPVDIIVVDQNDDDRLAPIINAYEDTLPLRRIRTPGERGLSRGRNVGWPRVNADLIVLPDDDCWYPADYLERASRVLTEQNADIVTGRAADDTGRSINGRFETEAQWINRTNVWTTQIEWVVMFRKSALERVGGYDVDIGIGASTPFQACEGQDITLRALDAGLTAYFDPSLVGHHAEFNTRDPDLATRRKGRGYARGMGRVLRLHGYGVKDAAFWLARPAARCAIALATLRFNQVLYFWNVFAGRFEGFAAPR